MELKKYIYAHGNDAAVDRDFEHGILYGKVRLGNRYIFWRKAFRWYVVDTDFVVRVYRRVEEVNAGMCCARANFDIQKLMLVLEDGSSLPILIAEGNEKDAVELYQDLQERHPELQYGKVS